MKPSNDRPPRPGHEPGRPDDSARAARLAAIRGSIARGDYETTERLEAAADRLLAAIGRDL